MLIDYYESVDKGYGLQGLRKGKRLGKQQGIEKGKLELVKRMLARSIPDDQICDLSQLSKAKNEDKCPL